jgi:hypothetical protein
MNEPIIEEVIEEPIVDATDLVVDEVVVEDDDVYEELIILDLRHASRQDAWLC